jgi:hypothetical protein
LDLAGYRGTHDAPFVADYFGIRDFYKTNPEIQAQVDEITEDLIEQTKGESLVFAAKDILDTLTSELNINENDTGLFKIRKALELMRAKRKLRTIDLMRAKVAQDIEKVL